MQGRSYACEIVEWCAWVVDATVRQRRGRCGCADDSVAMGTGRGGECNYQYNGDSAGKGDGCSCQSTSDSAGKGHGCGEAGGWWLLTRMQRRGARRRNEAMDETMLKAVVAMGAEARWWVKLYR